MRALLIFLLIALPLSAQRSTMCQTATVATAPTRNARQLLGCGDGFPDNVLWHLDRSDSVSGQLDGKARMKGGRGAVVYVLDMGIRRDHVEFARATGSNVIDGISVPGTVWGDGPCPNPVLSPCFWYAFHGTAVASIVAGANIGVAPDAQIVSVYTNFGLFAFQKAFKMIAAHAHAPTTPPFQTAIINISGGGPPGTRAEEEEELLRRMVNGVDANGDPDPNGRKFLIVAAAGNGPLGNVPSQCDAAGNIIAWPAGLGARVDGIIGVGAIARDNAIWENTCKGPLLEMLAPGVDMLLAATETANDLYVLEPARILSGTSYATPYVSGMAARLLGEHPSMTPAQLEAALKSSPSKVDGLPVPVSVFEPVPKRRAVRH